jgi:RsiW-degrading membrane proteinase PrsW (M82 family)
MSGLWVLLILIFIASVPAIAVYIWFRVTRYQFSSVRFLMCLLTGAAAFFPALVLQHLFPAAGTALASGKWGLFYQTFIRIALTEELSRCIMLLLFFKISGHAENVKTARRGAENIPAPLSYGLVGRGAACGLVAGLGFAILESAAYGASDAGVALLRAVTAAPLHGACGSRIGAAVLLFREHPQQAVFRFLSAAAIHGIYNFMIVMPGFPSLAAVLIALSALASSVLLIRSGIRGSGESVPYNK